MRVYMDNSATSFPKPKEVVEAMLDYMTEGGSNISRGMSSQAMKTGEKIFNLRNKLADFFGAESSKNVVFTKNITESLNLVIKGFVKEGDSVMVSSLEHNAVMRPLVQQGAKIVAIPVSKEGKMDLKFAEEYLPKVKAVFCTHISNVSGDVMPIADLSELAHRHNKAFILDSAQSAGFLKVRMDEMPIDCLCFTGHKSLLGPTGTGGLIFRSEFAKRIPCFITGGTGSKSHEEVHPELMPDKFEAGTQNIVGLLGLLAGLDYIERIGLGEIYRRETELGQIFYEKISALKGFRIIGSQDYSKKAPVFSLDFFERDNADVSFLLGSRYEIDNRPGLHCAPRAHQSYGSFPQGTVRLSLSYATKEEEIDYAVGALHEILKN